MMASYVRGTEPIKYKVVVLGPSGAGKTALINGMLRKRFNSNYEPTNEIICSKTNHSPAAGGLATLEFTEIPGYQSLETRDNLELLRNANAVMVVVEMRVRKKDKRSNRSYEAVSDRDSESSIKDDEAIGVDSESIASGEDPELIRNQLESRATDEARPLPVKQAELVPYLLSVSRILDSLGLAKTPELYIVACKADLELGSGQYKQLRETLDSLGTRLKAATIFFTSAKSDIKIGPLKDTIARVAIRELNPEIANIVRSPDRITLHGEKAPLLTSEREEDQTGCCITCCTQ